MSEQDRANYAQRLQSRKSRERALMRAEQCAWTMADQECKVNGFVITFRDNAFVIIAGQVPGLPKPGGTLTIEEFADFIYDNWMDFGYNKHGYSKDLTVSSLQAQ